MLHTTTGVGVDAARLDRNTPLHQLTSQLALRFENPGRMYVDVQQPPWRVIRAFAQKDGSSLVHLHNVSGGVLAGDHLSLNIDVRAGASAQVTTTGATRLYRHREGSRDSEQHVSITVGEDALLEYLPDAMIPFAGSRHSQYTTIRLADRATFLWWEILAPGRQAMQEVFAFDRLRIKTGVHSPTRPLLFENFTLEPASRPLASIARLGPYTHLANFHAFSIGASPSTWLDLESKFNELCSAHSSPGDTIWGSSRLSSDGIVVRGMSITTRKLPATLAAVWKIAKLALTGRDAILPRKVY